MTRRFVCHIRSFLYPDAAVSLVDFNPIRAESLQFHSKLDFVSEYRDIRRYTIFNRKGMGMFYANNILQQQQ